MAQPLVERAERGTVIGTDGQMQGITGPQIELRLVAKPSSSPERRCVDREVPERVDRQLRKLRQYGAPLHHVDLTGSHFDRERGRELRHHPIANRQLG